MTRSAAPQGTTDLVLQFRNAFANDRLQAWPMWREAPERPAGPRGGAGAGAAVWAAPRRRSPSGAVFAAVCGAWPGSARPVADSAQFGVRRAGLGGAPGENPYRALARLALINASGQNRLGFELGVVPAMAIVARPPARAE
jgi:hypothetical protein